METRRLVWGRQIRCRVSPAAWLLLVAVLLGGCQDAGPTLPRRAVLLITVDTLRADRTTPYDRSRDTTPNMARLAERGALYTHAFAASSLTAPSHTSIMTGLYPSHHTVGVTNGYYRLHESSDTLAEIARERGYRTAAIVSNPVLAASLGLDQGFELYDDQLETQELNRDFGDRRADVAVDKAIAWLESDDARPYFLWVHLQDAHGPYDPPEGWVCTSDHDDPGRAGLTLPVGPDHSGFEAIPAYQVYGEERDVADYERRYDCEISFLDQQLGRLLESVDAHPLGRETLVVLTADHGESLGEDGFYFAHGHSVGLDQVHVPLILAGPELPPGAVIEQPVSNVSIFQAVRSAFGERPRDDAMLASLRDLATGAPTQVPPVFVESMNQIGVAVGDAFYRQDRRPATDHAFWGRTNPNSGGMWKRLGDELVRWAPSTQGAAPITLAELRRQAGTYAGHAYKARTAIERLREDIPLSADWAANLAAIGYLR